mgnify:CR=1 FL=1
MPVAAPSANRSGRVSPTHAGHVMGDLDGRIDIVVNNAATRPSASFETMTYEEWRAVLATDLDAAFIASRAAVPGMIERGWGRIINFSGLSAFQVSAPAAVGLCAAGFALVIRAHLPPGRPYP